MEEEEEEEELRVPLLHERGRRDGLAQDEIIRLLKAPTPTRAFRLVIRRSSGTRLGSAIVTRGS